MTKLRFPYDGPIPPPIVDGAQVAKKVPPETLELLNAGDLAISKVNKHLPYGAGNIEHDLQSSRYRSYETMVYTRECSLPADPKDSFEKVCQQSAITRAGKGGNCGEHGWDSAATLNKLVPAGTIVNVCEFPGLDHAFVVLGKVKIGSPDNAKLVAVDAWPTKSQAVIVEDFDFGKPAQLTPFCSYVAEGPSAAGKKRITSLVPKVVNADGEQAVSHPAPVFADGTEVDDHVWKNTHATKDNQVFTYVADDSGDRVQPPLVRTPGAGVSIEIFYDVAAKGAWRYYGPFKVAEGGKLEAKLEGKGDADLFIRKGGKPSAREYDSVSNNPTANETASICGRGEYYVGVRGITGAKYGVEISYNKGP